jgi:hypothetical protein
VNGTRLSEGFLGTATSKKARWLPRLENELRCRMGWVDEVVSPFARARRQTKTKPATRLTRADTLLFPSGERKSA